MSQQGIGFGDFDGAKFGYEILASTVGVKFISGTVVATTRDILNPDGSANFLRKGLVLIRFAFDSTTFKYRDFFSGNDAADIAILAENIEDITKGEVVAKLIWAGALKTSRIIDPTGTIAWADVQRIERVSVTGA